MESEQNVSSLRKWLIASRPFALPASTMPVLFGTVAALVFGGASLNLPLFLMALLAMILLHSASNMLSDVHDFKRGLDVVPTPVSGAVVRGLLSPKEVQKGAIIVFGIGSLIGLLIVWKVGMPIFIVGIIGVVIGFFYTLLKYHGFGDLAVFLDFGTLGALGAWTVQTGYLSWLPVIWSVPISMLVVAILHANNWRDIASDGKSSVVTVASLLGDRGSLIYYGFMIFGPFIYITLLVISALFPNPCTFGMPPEFLLVWLALPMALIRWKRARNRKQPVQPLDFVALDGATAQLNLIFGLLCTTALLLHALIGRFI